MIMPSLQVNDQTVLEYEHFQQLLAVLNDRGYQVVGPTVRDGAIVYDTLTSVADLPVGYTDEQDGGTYRLKKRADEALFGYAVGPHSWKKFLHPPVLRLWQARREGNGFQVIPENQEVPRLAFIGVRSCELHAIAIQDRVFTRPGYTDPTYQSRRNNLFIVAVNCTQAGGTCFCTSMKHRRTHGSEYGYHWHQGFTLRQPGASALRKCRLALPDVHQLHDGLSYVFLYDGRGCHRPGRRTCRTLAQVGLMLHDGFLIHLWWEYPFLDQVTLQAVDDAQTCILD